MKQNVEVPAVGESVAEGILAVWFKRTGETVQEGEDLFELETDKATMPVPAPATGVLTIKVEADQEVEIGRVVAEIDTAGKPVSGGDVSGAKAGAHANADAEDSERDVSRTGASGETQDTSVAPVSPAVRRVLQEHNLDPAAVTARVTPSGKDGRLTKADVEAFLRDQGAAASDAGLAPENGSAAETASRAAETAQSDTDHSGQTPAPAQERAPQGQTPAQERTPVQERTKMTTLRKRIAENLVRSQRESAHLSTFNEVDMSAVMKVRASHKDQFEQHHGVRLGFMSFFVKAAQRSLREYPAVNAFVEGDEIVYNHFYSIGVAISTDRGLLVPVLRDVDALGFAAIEARILDFARRAKEKRIMPDEFSGGTFTITNGGVFGSMLSTPIPSPPQTAVMGMHSIQKRAVVVDDEIVIRPMMYLALTYDHRVIDGREAIGFLNGVKRRIEDPMQLMLEL